VNRIALKLACLIALLYIGLCTTLYVFQRSLLYFPQPRGLPEGQDLITLAVDGANLVVTVRPRPGPDALVYFGGNAEDVASSRAALSTAFPEYSLYLLHYRAYGGSTGKPSEAALFADSVVLFDKVYDAHPRILVIGRSLGTGVAVHLASVRPVYRLALVTPYDSLAEIAQSQYPYIPARWLLKDRFDSRLYAPHVTAPTVVIAAEHDELIPRSSTEALYHRFASGVARYRVLNGTSHNTIGESPGYLPLLQEAAQSTPD